MRKFKVPAVRSSKAMIKMIQAVEVAKLICLQEDDSE